MRKAVLAVLVFAVAATSSVDASFQGETFLANAIAMGGGPTGTFRIEFNIERWSTAEEREEFFRILVEEGQEALGTAMHRAGDGREIGYVRVNTRLSYPIAYAYQFSDGEGGRRVVIATDRPIGALEAISGSRTLDYSISVAELQLGPDGRGEGALMVAAAVAVDTEHGSLVLENFGQAPVRLRNVRPG